MSDALDPLRTALTQLDRADELVETEEAGMCVSSAAITVQNAIEYEKEDDEAQETEECPRG